MNEQKSLTLSLPTDVSPAALVGPNDEIFHLVQDAFTGRITLRGNTLYISASEVELQSITTLFHDLFSRLSRGEELTREEVVRSLDLLKAGELSPSTLKDDVVLSHRGIAVRPKTPTQKAYVDAIRSNTITFGIGPAGTGKTYLAMACAVAALASGRTSRIVLTRPVVEAGENLGFLPGTLTEKIDPYLRPLYDALFELMNPAQAKRALEDNTIEIAPLAFMRGRTLNDAFVVLDEAQNTTSMQMKMFLTRLGLGSKMVITGDITQTDLPHGTSGLKSVRHVLEGLDDIVFCEFKDTDVVRHSLVARIVKAYARAEAATIKL